MNAQKLFLTFLGTGFSPKNPAIAAALAALLTGLAILTYFGMETLFMLTLAVVVIGIFEINKYMNLHKEDVSEIIVIDKVAGMWLSLMIAFSTAVTMQYPYADMAAVLLSFLGFTLFDIWKPSTIGWIAGEVKGGLGKMMSSVLSGIAGGLLSVVVLMGMARVF
jgi:phosphatidylglycerophosphatase A